MKGALRSGLAFILLLAILVYHHKTVPVKVREWSDRFYEVRDGSEDKGVFVTKSNDCEERVAVKEVEADIVARHLMYCENYKIASSTWVTHLFKGRIHHEAHLRFSLRAQNITNRYQLRNITSFIVVRDPFERLLSAYTVSNDNREAQCI